MAPPLEGIRVVELAGLAPVPFAGLLLSDYGASVLRVDRAIPPSKPPTPTLDVLTRHKSSITLDLKSPAGIAFLKSLLKHADVLLDPYRPGVLEKLGMGPDELLKINPRLVIGRLTGFRRDGKYSQMAGHDINYVAVSGVLSQLGRKEGNPYPPANLLADFAGGGLACAFGVLAALIAREKTGKGQVVEQNMVDGAAYLATFQRLGTKLPMWDQPRGENWFDGGCPWYETYECKDKGRYVAVGAVEPQFFKILVEKLGLKGRGLEGERYDRSKWDGMKALFTEIFKTKTRDEWEAVFDGTDACVTPVLEQGELEQGGYEQRLLVDLRGTPGKVISPHEAWKTRGLMPGTGGQAIIEEWTGWRKGRDFDFVEGGFVSVSKAKL
ncbi:alpha-methylacyl-CoA racemase [Ascobolus immersus RN42]|uniref:Alpha-methylacyl-CoA racemase n=1 Tax=Ascobolus immersus RN42 TaxID=1160509 RepID=A0A3N4IQL1_ASCIM|nr:alpha-methylacyl-CoA racemase [Ascobolus immersus RN42]